MGYTTAEQIFIYISIIVIIIMVFFILEWKNVLCIIITCAVLGACHSSSSTTAELEYLAITNKEYIHSTSYFSSPTKTYYTCYLYVEGEHKFEVDPTYADTFKIGDKIRVEHVITSTGSEYWGLLP